MPSVHDPEMRHGRKSAQKRFDGHKAQIAVDTESQLIVAVDVLAGNAPDNTGALAMVKEAEQLRRGRRDGCRLRLREWGHAQGVC